MSERTMLQAMHEAIRRDLSAFRDCVWSLDVDAAGTGERLRVWFESIWSVVQQARRAQEEVAFPLLRERARGFGELGQVLSAEYSALDAAAPDIVDALRGYVAADARVDRVVWRGTLSVRVTRFAGALFAHLGREERELIPLIRRHFSRDEQRALERMMRRRAPLRTVGLFLSWVLADAAPDDEARA